MTIYKYEIPAKDGEFKLRMPHGAQPLLVQMQGEKACLWVQVYYEHMHHTDHAFTIYGTGQKIDQCAINRYVGTFQNEGYVWHLFANFYE